MQEKTKKRVERILELVKQGKSPTQASKEVGMNPKYFYYARKMMADSQRKKPGPKGPRKPKPIVKHISVPISSGGGDEAEADLQLKGSPETIARFIRALYER